jgi:hypothetical protein
MSVGSYHHSIFNPSVFGSGPHPVPPFFQLGIQLGRIVFSGEAQGGIGL